ncbi:MAG: tRNA (guanosine(37)-N1)-methyltransferase TrmD [Candidatus Competibacteraceae bacterium]|nr:tRNA (guanosine(37)-N1)-methyltransferase TrmD [Candidatus Competibacteraceae bacterium]
MQIDIISVLPEMMESPLSQSIVQRARQKGLVQINLIGLREFGLGAYKQLDDYPYGGGGGMVLRVEPLAACIEHLLQQQTYDEIIYLTPDGEQLNQKTVNSLSTKNNLLLICGHYKGIDQRIRDKYVTCEISIGDYVLSGGEIAACVLADAIVRLIPGVLSDEMSALSDSFQDGLLAPPVYTRPEIWEGRSVPEVLISGHEKRIAEWRLEESIARTRKRRPDLLDE